jgi:hypothetical protein
MLTQLEISLSLCLSLSLSQPLLSVCNLEKKSLGVLLIAYWEGGGEAVILINWEYGRVWEL